MATTKVLGTISDEDKKALSGFTNAIEEHLRAIGEIEYQRNKYAVQDANLLAQKSKRLELIAQTEKSGEETLTAIREKMGLPQGVLFKIDREGRILIEE